MKTQGRMNNSFHIRIYDNDLLTSLNELAELKEFDSMNELICVALGVGVEKMYVDRGRRNAFAENQESATVKRDESLSEVLRRVKNISATMDDVFVLLNIVEMLMATLYNTTLMTLKGEAVSGELMESGFLSDLPENLRRVKDSLVKRLSKKER